MNYMNGNSCSNSCPNNSVDVIDREMPVGMAYVPWQAWNKIYDLDKALSVGTIFPCLDKPFLGRCSCK